MKIKIRDFGGKCFCLWITCLERIPLSGVLSDSLSRVEVWGLGL